MENEHDREDSVVSQSADKRSLKSCCARTVVAAQAIKTSAKMLAQSPLTKVHRSNAPANIKIMMTPALEIPAKGGSRNPKNIMRMPMIENIKSRRNLPTEISPSLF